MTFNITKNYKMKSTFKYTVYLRKIINFFFTKFQNWQKEDNSVGTDNFDSGSVCR